MLESTIHKIFWVIVVIVVIGVTATFLLNPTLTKAKDQTSSISGITYVAP